MALLTDRYDHRLPVARASLVARGIAAARLRTRSVDLLTPFTYGFGAAPCKQTEHIRNTAVQYSRCVCFLQARCRAGQLQRRSSPRPPAPLPQGKRRECASGSLPPPSPRTGGGLPPRKRGM